MDIIFLCINFDYQSDDLNNDDFRKTIWCEAFHMFLFIWISQCENTGTMKYLDFDTSLKIFFFTLSINYICVIVSTNLSKLSMNLIDISYLNLISEKYALLKFLSLKITFWKMKQNNLFINDSSRKINKR
jgi:hypothetical protein